MTKNLPPSKTCLFSAILISSFALAGTAKAGLLYDIIGFGNSTNQYNPTGEAINASGLVVGSFETKPYLGDRHAFVTNRNGAMIDLGTLGGIRSGANDINAAGLIVGSSETPDGNTHAFMTNSNGVMTDLGTFGGRNSAATAINAAGQVTGWAEDAANVIHAFITGSNGEMIDLGTDFNYGSQGRDINASGQVLGLDGGRTFITDGWAQRKYIYGLRTYTAIGSAINDAGLVTGGLWDYINGVFYDHAFVTDNSGQITDMGTLGGNYSWGNDINSSGQVVGTSTVTDNDYRAIVTDNGVIRDLNALLVSSATGWKLDWALGINDAGQITGFGMHNGLLQTFLLTPVSVPVPAAVWVMGSGVLGLLGLNARRRQNSLTTQ